MERLPNDKVKCLCGVLCTHTISNTIDNPNRIFVQCSFGKRGCGFWEWLDEIRMCRCKKGYCKLLTSHTKENKDRRFYCCPLSKPGGSKGCGLWGWFDEVQEEEAGSSGSSKKHDEVLKIITLLRTSCLLFETNRGGRRTMRCKALPKRILGIRAEVNYVNSEEAKELLAEGYSVLDIRHQSQYDRAHIKSCYHVPLFIENMDNDPGTIIKRTVHNNFSGLFFGLPFTKLNPEFEQSVKSQFSTDSKLLIVCQEGLRSSAAANMLEKAGFQNISCITSGLQSVKPGTFDSVGSTELQNAGKAGLQSVQGKISAVLGTVLVCAYLFIQFFPDQAEKLMSLATGS